MPKFIIEKVDPWRYREKIVQFWSDNLPGTPIERFEWLVKGNPAGPAAWFVAFDDASQNIAGMISVLPRELKSDGKTIRAGILGDFMVAQKYRVLGPSISLLKAALKSSSDLGYAFIYTIPNSQSEKMIQHVGFKEVGRLFYLAKPLRIYNYLEKYIGSIAARTIGGFIEFGIKVLSRETYYPSRGIIEDVSVIDGSFDQLSEMVMKRENRISGNCTKEFLTWRYLKNPHYVFRIAALKDMEGGLRGYAVYVIEGNCLEIYDLVARDNSVVQQLIRYVARVGRRSDCKSVYITVGPNSPWRDILKWNLFFDTKFDMKLYSWGNGELAKKEWCFFAGDRNI